MESLCNYETSLMLRETGFNGACDRCFDKMKNDPIDRQTPTDVFGNNKHNSSDTYLVACPSLKDAASWIREQYKIDIQVYTVPNTPLHTFRCYGLPFSTDGVAYVDTDSCRQAAVQYVLKVLLNTK